MLVAGAEARVVEEQVGGGAPGRREVRKGMRGGRGREQRQRSTWWSGSEPGHRGEKRETRGKGSWRRPGSSEDGVEVQVAVLADGTDAGLGELGSFRGGEGVGQDIG